LFAFLGLFLAYDALVAAAAAWLALPSWPLGAEAAVINGLVLGTLLAFRNKEAYDRWWEARKLWGQLVNDTRNLAYKVRAYVEAPAAELQDFGRSLAGFAHGLRLHLRRPGPLQQVPGFADDPAQPGHVPSYLAGRVLGDLARWGRAGLLGGQVPLLLDPHARGLLDVCGACERIRNTPLPASYRALLRHGILLYLLLAPWSLQLEVGAWGVAVLGLVTYFLLGIELTAEEVEEPFGGEEDDLPLAAYCRTIERAVEEALGTRPASR
jgi:putative membrane protein